MVSSNPHQRHRRQTAKGTQYPIGASAREDKTSSTVVESLPNPRAPEFEIFTNQQLQEMVQGVGLDTNGVARDELLKVCKSHRELSECFFVRLQVDNY